LRIGRAQTVVGREGKCHRPSATRGAQPPPGGQIASDADDYRYAGRAGHSIDIRAFASEPELADRCCRLTAKLGLVVAGISLRRTPEGRWFCCEVSPSPGFAVYQQATGGRVAEAIADLLAVGRRFAELMRLDRLA
jgi:hypothetical protein